MQSFRSHCCPNGERSNLDTSFFSRPRHRMAETRRGSAAILGLILSISLVTLMAFALDFGYINTADTQMRRCADAVAMAACWELYDQQVAGYETLDFIKTLDAANAIASVNAVGDSTLQLDPYDLELGRYKLDGSWDTSDPQQFNAVRVNLRLQGANSELPLFFGELTGRHSQSLQSTATAAMFNSISGFYEPGSDEETIEILPIALDLESWQDVVAGNTGDSFNFENGEVKNGTDGICEISLYPTGTGSPGNRGTVDIGAANNSTADLSRQIVHGISKQDFIDLDKPLKFDEDGELELNGDTGISAGIKDELASIVGKHRIIPIFSKVQGNGNNAMYTIVAWEGVTILDVKLTGKKTAKHVTIQPRKMIARNAMIDQSGTNASSHIITPVLLVE